MLALNSDRHSLIVQQKIPVDGCLTCFLPASEHPLPCLLPQALRSTRIYIPHPKFDTTVGANHDFVYASLINLFIQANIPHDTVNETGGECRLPSAMNVPFEIGWKPKSNIGRATLDFEVEIGAGVLAAHFGSNRRRTAG